MLDKTFLDEQEKKLRAELEKGVQEIGRLTDAVKHIQGALLFVAEARAELEKSEAEAQADLKPPDHPYPGVEYNAAPFPEKKGEADADPER